MVPDAIRRLDHIRKRSYELANALPMKAMIKAAQWGLLFLVDVPEPDCLLGKGNSIASWLQMFICLHILPSSGVQAGDYTLYSFDANFYRLP